MAHTYPFAREALAEERSAFDEVWLDERPDFEDALLLVESVGQWVQAAGRELRARAPGALQGALTGLTVGGPTGALVGAAAGGLGVPLPTGGSQLVQAPGVAPGTASVAGATLNPAALQLLAALLSPELVQALSAMAFGTGGVSTVNVAGKDVPVAAFATLLSELGARAAAQQHALKGPMTAQPSYAAKLAEPASPAKRADALLELLIRAEELDEQYADELDADVLMDARMQVDLYDIARLGGE